MVAITDHPLRYKIANELHARPFPSLEAPSFAAFLAIKQPVGAGVRSREVDRAHLLDLLDRFGAAHPPPDATHYFGDLGKHRLKWESHSEFVTYTVFGTSPDAGNFDAARFDAFPEDWLANMPGKRLTSALICIRPMSGDEKIRQYFAENFVLESLAASRVVDGSAVVAGDFRIDSAGHMRFAVLTRPGIGARRVGRIVQRLCEIETYKAMAMLGFQRARELSVKLGPVEQRLTALFDDMMRPDNRPDQSLRDLLAVSTELEGLLAQMTYRFGATEAYRLIVDQRIAVLREDRFEGRQSFADFMSRRFDPAMRTVASTRAQLDALAERAMRGSQLLRTQVDVARSEQNQKVLESMDRRADLQLRLQNTVEGLSVVAISYYAVNLVSYVLAPFAKGVGIEKPLIAGVATPLVLAGVWLMVRHIRKKMH
jgi:uncharacterized membrane-anchored protein